MRKIIVLVLIACLALSFTSCFAEEGKGDIQTEKRNVTSVEITLENWSTYFVLKEEPWWMENDFGEVDEMKLKTVIELRPEYYVRVAGESEIAFEVSGKVVSSVHVTVIKNLTHNLRPYAIIENVVTHADHRCNGYGSALLSEATEFAKKHNCYKVFLETGSNKESTLNFYRKNGFSVDAKHSCLKRL